jgi:hypothetical protein
MLQSGMDLVNNKTPSLALCKPAFRKQLTLLAIVCLYCLFGYSQVNVQFVPSVYGRTVDGLGNFSIQNRAASGIEGYFTVSVQVNNGRQVVELTTPVILVNPGLSSLPKNAFAKSKFMFALNDYGKISSQTRAFPPVIIVIAFGFFQQNR